MKSGCEGARSWEAGMSTQDDIGSRGEFLFGALIMNFCDRDLPFFRPRYLGEKARTLDFLVELVDAGDRTLFFFAHSLWQ